MHHRYFARVVQILLQRNVPTTSRLSMSMSSASSTTTSPAYPRAAVAVTVQSQLSTSSVHHYLLVQRANPPDQGKWSLPGGKIEVGEATLDAAQREITEETQLLAEDCEWLPFPFMTTDAIVYGPDDSTGEAKEQLSFHYLIAQCFARAPDGLPELTPSDDALDAKWYTLQEIQDSLMAEDKVSRGVLKVIQRAEELHDKGALL
jgi:8-oxo-dGTP diphosphatase